jgi:hypothetical protein
MKAISKLSLFVVALLFTNQVMANSFRYDLDFRVDSEVTSSSGATVYTLTQNSGGEDVLKPVFQLEKGDQFSFRPGTTFQGRYYLGSDGSQKTIRGRYFGSLILSKSGHSRSDRRIIDDLNKQRIFIYEWQIDKKPYIIKAFNEEPAFPNLLPSESFRWEEVNPKRAWTSYAADFIHQNKETFFEESISDIGEFCPGFVGASDEKKVAFWIHLLNSLSKRESAFDPMVSNDESNFGSGDLTVISRGLLQTSLASSRAYRSTGCMVRDDKDLHNPQTSITCGLAIFKRWLDTDGCISCKNSEGKHRGIARYWSPLRERYQVPCKICRGGVANIGFRKVIISETSQFPSCQL